MVNQWTAMNKRQHHGGYHHKQQKPKSFAFVRRFLEWDQRLTQSLAISASTMSSYGKLRPVWKLIEISCHGIPWLLGTTLLLVFCDDPHIVELTVNIVFALVMDLVTVILLKYSLKRPRPAHNKMDMFATISLDNYSFPSGHATRAALLTYFAHTLLAVNSEKLFLIWFWSFVVTASRVFLGRHYVSDAISGYLIGLIEFIWFLQVGWVDQKSCVTVGNFMRKLNYWNTFEAD